MEESLLVKQDIYQVRRFLNTVVYLFTLYIITFPFSRDIPVDMKYIADPTMHSMPAVTPSPNQKWLACQSMDNKIVIFSALNRFKMNRKKTFSGHMVAGYACTLDFSPDMRFVISTQINIAIASCLKLLNMKLQ